MELLKGDIVEAHEYRFRFYKNGIPTRHYMRGIVKKVKDISCIVESLSNGQDYEITKDILIKIND